MKYNFLNNKLDAREKALERGIGTLFDSELICLILGTGTKEYPIKYLSQKIVSVMDETENFDLVDALQRIKGIGSGKALAVAAALELGKRRSAHLKAPVTTPMDLIPFVRNYAVSAKEHFIVVTLNGSHEIIQIHITSVGTLNRSLVHPREVFTEAIQEKAAAIILCHNHPSENCRPSRDDIETTKMLIKASRVIGIPILDHIIVDCEGYFSFMENKILFSEEN